ENDDGETDQRYMLRSPIHATVLARPTTPLIRARQEVPTGARPARTNASRLVYDGPLRGQEAPKFASTGSKLAAEPYTKYCRAAIPTIITEQNRRKDGSTTRLPDA